MLCEHPTIRTIPSVVFKASDSSANPVSAGWRSCGGYFEKLPISGEVVAIRNTPGATSLLLDTNSTLARQKRPLGV